MPRPRRSRCPTGALLRLAALAVALILAQGCATQQPQGPAEMLQAGPQAAANREAQTRRITDAGEAELLAACVAVLQDLGFSIKASQAQLGVITAFKPRSIEEILGDIGRISLLGGVTFGLHPDLAVGPHSSFGVVIGTRPVGGDTRVHDLRVTFYQVWNAPPGQEGLRGVAVITSPTLYQKFFGMVSATMARSRAGG